MYEKDQWLLLEYLPLKENTKEMPAKRILHDNLNIYITRMVVDCPRPPPPHPTYPYKPEHFVIKVFLQNVSA